MGLLKTLVIVAVACVFLVEGESPEEKDSEITSIEGLIRRELDAFASMQDDVRKANLNITVLLSYSKIDENGDVIYTDHVGLNPLSLKYNPEGLPMHETITEELLKETFEFAQSFNATAVVSQEKYLEDGSLYSMAVYAEDLEIVYEDGNSNVIFDASESAMTKDEQSFEDFLNILKDYELPVEVTKVLYNEDGEVLKTDATKYEPRKVRIEGADGMPVGMKMKAAEALKRAFVIKDTGRERMALVCRYLGIEFSDYTWQAVIGEGQHYLDYDVWVKLVLDGDTYMITGKEE